MKLNNFVIYIIVVIIVLLSFKLPELILKYEEDNMEMSYYWEQRKSKIDVETEKIYLVKAIHDIQEELSKVEIVTNASKHGQIIEFNNEEMKHLEIAKNCEKELLKLQEYNIIKYPETIESASGDGNTNDEYNAMSIIDRGYAVEGKSYTISNIELILKGNMYEFELENKSGKILFISFDKNELSSEMTDEQIMRNYVNYLDLHIIDDWTLEDGRLKSEKAGLIVSLVKSEKMDTCLLSIYAIDKYYEITDSNNIKTVVVEKDKN